MCQVSVQSNTTTFPSTRSLKGSFRRNISKKRAIDLALGMHDVVVDMRYKGKTNPGLRCTCKGFVHKGLCSCCLMVMHIEETINLEKYLERWSCMSRLLFCHSTLKYPFSAGFTMWQKQDAREVRRVLGRSSQRLHSQRQC